MSDDRFPQAARRALLGCGALAVASSLAGCAWFRRHDPVPVCPQSPEVSLPGGPLTIDAHLLRATIDWCMVFGSDKSNPTHWKRLSITESKVLYQSFREGLFNATGLDRDTWQKYWESMTDFRNKYVAHRELEFASPVPNFDTALAVAYYYDNWVRRIISHDTFAEPTLESFAISLQRSVVPLVAKLLEVTGGLAEPSVAGDAQ